RLVADRLLRRGGLGGGAGPRGWGTQEMARSAAYSGRGFGRGMGMWVRGWDELAGGARRRLFEGGGFALMLTGLLIFLALRAYRPTDPSFDPASDTAPHNFLGLSGSVLADALLQAIGLAAYLIPLVLTGWAFRLLLQRPLRHLPRRLMQLFLALLFGAFACS